MVIITDCEYRSSLAVMYSLKKLDESFVAITTDKAPAPPSFYSKYAKDKRILSSEPQEYKKQLIALCREFDRPTIFPIGVFTLNIIAENKSEFEEVADFCVADKCVLDILNDKKQAKRIAESVGLSVPKSNGDYPLVVKPFCGEKFGLKASDRYKIVNNDSELREAINAFSKYDTDPIIEEYVEGDGAGVSVIIGKDGRSRSAFCHMRLSEFPSSGGPSSSLVTFIDYDLIKQAVNMLKSVGFVGIAMLEFKKAKNGYCFLEVNPRVWGSFGATFKTKSDFVTAYLAGARGKPHLCAPDYRTMKVKFVPNIFASVISYAKAKEFKKAFSTLLDALNPFVPNAIFSIKDPLPALRDIFRKRR